MAQEAKLSQYAADRARLLLGCYRKGDANDPETYVAAIAATLSRYPEEVITAVTHPASGLPATIAWLPSVKEVHDACESAMYPIQRRAEREKRIREQLAAREDHDRDNRPTIEQMKARYGDNWGLSADPKRDADARAADNRRAVEQAQERVRREYAAQGSIPPSSLALSPTALKSIAEADAQRDQVLRKRNGAAA